MWLSPLSTGINFFIMCLCASWRPSLSPISRATPSSKSDTAVGDYLSSFLALGVILIGVAKSSTGLSISLGISWPSKDGDILDNHRCWCYWSCLVVVLLFRPPAHIFWSVLAQSMGVRVQVYHYLAWVLRPWFCIFLMQSVGTILIIISLLHTRCDGLSLYQ